MVDAIKPLTMAAAARGASAVSAGAAATGGGFGEALKAALDQVNGAQNNADTLAQRFQLGDPGVSLEETMIAMQKSSISFQAVVQARNRLMTAYHDIMNMSV